MKKPNKNRISEARLHEIWTLIDAGYTRKEISGYTGIGESSIRRYAVMHDAGILDPFHTSTTRKVILCIQHGYSMSTIRQALGIRDEESLDKILEEIGYSDDGTYTHDDIADLISRWHWKRPKGKQKRVSDDGYRIVYVGEKSGFRTPYRPDGRWL